MSRPAWVDDEPYPFTDRWADAGGTRLHDVDEGDGTPILTVHGNPTWSFLYPDIIRELILMGQNRGGRPTWVFAREVTGAGDFLEHEAATALRALADRPALLPWRDADPVFSPPIATASPPKLPRAEVHPRHGAGHFIQEDAPEEIAAAIGNRWARR